MDLDALEGRMARPKLHHYVPRFYLDGFADRIRPRSVWVYEKGSSSPRLQGIKSTAAETYYYAIDTPAGEKEDFLESRYLAPIESAAAPIIKYLRDDPRPAVLQDHVVPLASFLTALYARSPLLRWFGEEFFAAFATAQAKRHFRGDRAIQEFLADNPTVPLSLGEIRDLVTELDDPGKWSIRLTKNLRVALQFQHVASFYAYFRNRRMSILIGSGDPDFLTCDSPLTVFDLDPSGRACIGVGIGRTTAEIVLPLSPVRALRLTNAPTPSRQRVSASVVHDINRRLVYQARQYVFASRHSKRIAAFVSSWFGKRQDLRVDPVAMAAYARRFRAGDAD